MTIVALMTVIGLTATTTVYADIISTAAATKRDLPVITVCQPLQVVVVIIIIHHRHRHQDTGASGSTDSSGYREHK